MKINTYRVLRNAYGDMKGAEVEGTKQLARGLKDQIASVFPEIADLNAKQSTHIGLEDALQRAIWRMDGRDLIPLGTTAAAGVGHAMGGDAGAAVGLVSKILDHPEAKSRLAIALASRGIKEPGKFIADRLKHVVSATQAGVVDFTPPGTEGVLQ